MLLTTWGSVWRVAASAALAYLSLVVILRVSGKRTLAKLNAFDFVVTIALGSTLSTIVLSRDVPLVDGVVALASLVLLQMAVAWASVRAGFMGRVSRSQPVVLVRDGEIDAAVARRERVLTAEIEQAVRGAGAGSIELVGAVVLESDGTLSVITRDKLGSAGAIPTSSPRGTVG